MARCEICAHFEFAGGDQGNCLRYPPSASVLLVPQRQLVTAQQGLGPQNFTAWPIVQATQRCGEFSEARGKIALS